MNKYMTEQALCHCVFGGTPIKGSGTTNVISLISNALLTPIACIPRIAGRQLNERKRQIIVRECPKLPENLRFRRAASILRRHFNHRGTFYGSR
jgi:hypothetical protein